MGLALTLNVPTGIGRRPSTIWGGDEYEALLVKQAASARQNKAAHRQWLLDEHTARARQQEAARQEAARAAQRLLHKRAALERQGEAAPSPTRHSGTADGGYPSHLPVALPPTPLCPARSPDLAATAA